MSTKDTREDLRAKAALGIQGAIGARMVTQADGVGKLRDVGSQSATKAAERAASFWESTKTRFVEAVAAFNARLDLEEETQKLIREKKAAKPRRILESLVMGLLVSAERHEAIVLFDGNNGFRVDEKGVPFRTMLQHGFGSAQTSHLHLRVINGYLEVTDASQEARRFTTNDFVTLGNQRYLLKLFPREYQTEKSFLAEESR